MDGRKAEDKSEVLPTGVFITIFLELSEGNLLLFTRFGSFKTQTNLVIIDVSSRAVRKFKPIRF